MAKFQNAINEMCYEDDTQTTNVENTTTSEASAKGEYAVDILIAKDDRLRPYIELIDTEGKTTTEILDEITTIIEEEEEPTIDTSAIKLSTVNYGHLYIDEVGDITIATTVRAEIIIEADSETILDDMYEAGLDGNIHLDLRELILSHTDIALPEVPDDNSAYYDEQESSKYQLDITVKHYDGSIVSYVLLINSFKESISEKMSDLDRIDIPDSAIIPISLYRDNNLNNAPVTVSFVTALRRMEFMTMAIGDGDSSLISFAIPLSKIPYRPMEPFYLEFKIAVDRNNNVFPPYNFRTVRTPVYRVTNQEAEMYFFLNDYGNYDLVAMTGSMSARPEFDIENAFRSLSIEKVRGTKKNLYNQNTGPLSRKNLATLSELLLSRKIFRYEPATGFRRIVVENPSVNLKTNQSINTATFSWRYADK